MNKQEFLILVDKYLSGKATREEEALLINFYNSYQQNEEWDALELGPEKLMEDKLLVRLSSETARQKNIQLTPLIPLYKRFWPYMAAAGVILVLCTGILLFVRNKPTPQVARVQPVIKFKNDVSAGTNGAVLTLSDGSKIILDSTGNGTITKQGNTRLVKKGNGQIAYEAAGDTKEILYNTLTTDRGKQFQVMLPDGTKVWLNAASSLRYPTSFTGRERVVQVSGEAYFEVTHNAAMPFIVKTKGQQIRVLGTHFNVNTYPDDPLMKTTLLEGSVEVSDETETVVIKPGEQSSISPNSKKISVAEVNTEVVVAWKNGFFAFDKADMQAVMRQLARWYNVEIKFENGINRQQFSGKIDRNLSLAQVLKGLEKVNAHFRIEEDKRIVILP